jgi:hypothetical protein
MQKSPDLFTGRVAFLLGEDDASMIMSSGCP